MRKVADHTYREHQNTHFMFNKSLPNRLKGKLTPLTGEIDTDWMKIKEAIAKAAEGSIGYKKWKNRKWLRTWNEEIRRAIEEKKYLQNKTVYYYIEYKRHRAIARKMI